MDKLFDSRKSAPGMTWLYCKIYIGSSLADKLLSGELYDTISIITKDYAEAFFFVRYFDPNYHLRLRFKLKDPCWTGEVIAILLDSIKNYFHTNQVWRIQYDTYVREVERYGENTIEECEYLFYNDSIACIEIIRNTINCRIEERAYVAIKLIDQLMRDFGLTQTEKATVIEHIAILFKKEFGIIDNSTQLNKLYRDWSPSLSRYLNGERLTKTLAICDSIIEKKSERDLPIIRTIKDKTSQERQYDLIKSFTHMMMNRLFVSKQRLMEAVLYDTLRKYYRSLIAREKHTSYYVPNISSN